MNEMNWLLWGKRTSSIYLCLGVICRQWCIVKKSGEAKGSLFAGTISESVQIFIFQIHYMLAEQRKFWILCAQARKKRLLMPIKVWMIYDDTNHTYHYYLILCIHTRMDNNNMHDLRYIVNHTNIFVVFHFDFAPVISSSEIVL